jgi:hypothetical protein
VVANFFPTDGIIGSACVGKIEPGTARCVSIGPVGGSFFGIIDNSSLANAFKGVARNNFPPVTLLQAGF